MKFICILVLLSALLCGCTQPALETVNDVYVTQPPEERRTIHIELPQDAAEAVMEGREGARLYLCDGYELRLQTIAAGDLDEVLRILTGYGEDRLTLMKTKDGSFDRYDCVWCSAGEEGELVGRSAILADGNYYYCVSALAKSEDAYALQETWQQLLETVEVS